MPSDAPNARPDDASEPRPPIEGERRTARSVLFTNLLAGGIIRTGGLLVIVAVVGILVFLVATVLPLFRRRFRDRAAGRRASSRDGRRAPAR